MGSRKAIGSLLRFQIREPLISKRIGGMKNFVRAIRSVAFVGWRQDDWAKEKRNKLRSFDGPMQRKMSYEPVSALCTHN